jgi:hypothetical protein
MVNVTDAAKDYLMAMQATAAPPDGTVLRLIQSGNRLAFTFSEPEPGDEVIWKAEQEVLHISEPLVEPLSGVTLDVDATGDEPKLTLVR